MIKHTRYNPPTPYYNIVKTTCTRAEFMNPTSAFSCSAVYFISQCCWGSAAILLRSHREPGAVNVNMIGVILSLGCAPASLTEEPLRASPLHQPIAPRRSLWLCLKPISPRERSVNKSAQFGPEDEVTCATLHHPQCCMALGVCICLLNMCDLAHYWVHHCPSN